MAILDYFFPEEVLDRLIDSQGQENLSSSVDLELANRSKNRTLVKTASLWMVHRVVLKYFRRYFYWHGAS